ncbi:MAG: serine--tRNA ligase, partial [bacterium]
MLDIKLIREQEDKVRQGLAARGASTEYLDAVVADDALRRKGVTEVETLKNQRNVVSKEIGVLKSKGLDTAATQAAMRDLGDLITRKDGEVRDLEARLKDNLLRIPNLPHSSLPVGTDASANVVVRTFGKPREFAFQPKGHVEVGERLGIFDFARGAKITGSGF